MSESNKRIKECNMVHHLMSRVAHGVYLLTDDSARDFQEMMFRVADFCGIQLLGWCVMSNHFHILAYLPPRVEINDEELLARYRRLKGQSAILPKEADKCEKLRNRMYDVGEFMKILKQWFTEEFNRRRGHRGTLWQAKYKDKLVKMTTTDMAKRLAYIHLNPIRAAASAGFDDYPFSSFSAARNGSERALLGLKFIYGNKLRSFEIMEQHEFLLEDLLEYIKRQRALEIARKRAHGYELPIDPLTNEAMVIQETDRLNRLANEVARFKLDDDEKLSRKERLTRNESCILNFLTLNPSADIDAVAKALGLCSKTTYRIIAKLEESDRLFRKSADSEWEIVPK